MKFAQKFLSRKFLAAGAGIIFAGLSATHPGLQPALVPVGAMVCAYIAGESVIDALRAATAGTPLQAIADKVALYKATETLPVAARKAILGSASDHAEALRKR